MPKTQQHSEVPTTQTFLTLFFIQTDDKKYCEIGAHGEVGGVCGCVGVCDVVCRSIVPTK